MEGMLAFIKEKLWLDILFVFMYFIQLLNITFPWVSLFLCYSHDQDQTNFKIP